MIGTLLTHRSALGVRAPHHRLSVVPVASVRQQLTVRVPAQTARCACVAPTASASQAQAGSSAPWWSRGLSKLAFSVALCFTTMFATCGSAFAAAAPAVAGGMKQAWHQSRTSLIATIQQLSAPQLLALLLCASFCCSILVIASNSSKGALTPVYEASSASSIHRGPWESSDHVADVDGEARFQQQSGFAATVLPFIAATSAGGILKGADTLWGPSQRVASAVTDPTQPSAPGKAPSAGQPNSTGAAGESVWPAVLPAASAWAKNTQKDTSDVLETSSEVSGVAEQQRSQMATVSVEASTSTPITAPAGAVDMGMSATSSSATATGFSAPQTMSVPVSSSSSSDIPPAAYPVAASVSSVASVPTVDAGEAQGMSTATFTPTAAAAASASAAAAAETQPASNSTGGKALGTSRSSAGGVTHVSYAAVDSAGAAMDAAGEGGSTQKTTVSKLINLFSRPGGRSRAATDAAANGTSGLAAQDGIAADRAAAAAAAATPAAVTASASVAAAPVRSTGGDTTGATAVVAAASGASAPSAASSAPAADTSAEGPSSAAQQQAALDAMAAATTADATSGAIFSSAAAAESACAESAPTSASSIGTMKRTIGKYAKSATADVSGSSTTPVSASSTAAVGNADAALRSPPPVSGAKRLENLAQRMPSSVRGVVAATPKVLDSAGKAAAGTLSSAAALFLPLVNAPRGPVTFTAPTVRPEIDPIAQVPKIQRPVSKPGWDPLAQISSAAAPLRSTHGAAWDPLHHVRNITPPTRANLPNPRPSAFDPVSHIAFTNPPSKGSGSWDPVRSVVKGLTGAEATRANNPPSGFDPVSQLLNVQPNSRGPSAPSSDPLNSALRDTTPPTRANNPPAIFDPLSMFSKLSARVRARQANPPPDPVNDALRGATAPTRANTPPSIYDPVSQLHSFPPTASSRGGAPSEDPLNRALRNADAPTRANSSPSMFDPVQAAAAATAPTEKPSWDPVQAAKNFKKQKSGSKVPFFSRSPSLSVPTDGSPAVAEADSDAPRWTPLRMFHRGSPSDNGNGSRPEADKQEAA